MACRGRDCVLGHRDRSGGWRAFVGRALLVATPASLLRPGDLPYTSASNICRGQQRVVYRAGPRVPVVPGTHAHCDGLRRSHRLGKRSARSGDCRPHARVEPAGADVGCRQWCGSRAAHQDGDRRLDQFNRCALTTDCRRRELRVRVVVRWRGAGAQHHRAGRGHYLSRDLCDSASDLYYR